MQTQDARGPPLIQRKCFSLPCRYLRRSFSLPLTLSHSLSHSLVLSLFLSLFCWPAEACRRCFSHRSLSLSARILIVDLSYSRRAANYSRTSTSQRRARTTGSNGNFSVFSDTRTHYAERHATD